MGEARILVCSLKMLRLWGVMCASLRGIQACVCSDLPVWLVRLRSLGAGAKLPIMPSRARSASAQITTAPQPDQTEVALVAPKILIKMFEEKPSKSMAKETNELN